MFSEQTQKILTVAGWSSDYSYDTARYKAIFAEAGCEVPEKVLKFLQSFGGLRLYYPHRIDTKPVMMEFRPLIGLEALKTNICKDLEHYAQRIGGDKIFPIGNFAGLYMLMMMDEQGIVYGAYDEFFVKVAESGIEAIEAICGGKDFEEID
jgi:hypothetical protein